MMDRLKEYIEKDEIYQDYKKDKLMNASDFDKFCIQHCKDIEELLEENEELKKQLENKYSKTGTLTNEVLYEENTKLINQQQEFIKYLEQCIENEKYCYLAEKQEDRVRKDIFEEILQKYKEIIGG